MCNFVVRIILEVKNVGNFVEGVVSQNLVFPHYSIFLSIEKSESERKSEKGDAERAVFFVTLEFLISFSHVTRLRPKVERKDRRRCTFGNCNKIQYSLTLSQISSLKYAPVTSCDVEGSLSVFKNVLSDKHMKLNEDNLQKLVVHYLK